MVLRSSTDWHLLATGILCTVYGHVINVLNHFNVPIRPSDERPPAMCGHFCLVLRVFVHDRYYCTVFLSDIEIEDMVHTDPGMFLKLNVPFNVLELLAVLLNVL